MERERLERERIRIEQVSDALLPHSLLRVLPAQSERELPFKGHVG